MSGFFHNTYVIETFIWLFMMAFMCFLADGPSKRVISIKRVLVCIFITLIVWGTVAAALIDAGKQMPPPQHIKSPTLEYTVRPVVKP